VKFLFNFLSSNDLYLGFGIFNLSINIVIIIVIHSYFTNDLHFYFNCGHLIRFRFFFIKFVQINYFNLFMINFGYFEIINLNF
jgi:hypothetical protein